MNTKLHILALFYIITCLLCLIEGREMHVQGGKIRASKINIQNWCGNAITHVRGEKNASKINIPALCTKCDCASGTCYCCAAYQPQYCWTSQKECIKQCQPQSNNGH